MIVPFAVFSLAALPAATDLSWMVDDEIPGRIEAAEAEADRLDALAAESERLLADVRGRKEAAAAEKEGLKRDLDSLPRLQRGLAQSRLDELSSKIATLEARETSLAGEVAGRRRSAQAQRAFASAARTERAARARAAAAAIGMEDELAGLPDARLEEAIAWLKTRLARVPSQLAALDRELEAASSVPDRAAVVARKERVRALAAADETLIRRLDDELRFRADTRQDEAIAAREMEVIARARASERESPAPSPAATGPDRVDRILDRVLAQQDRRAAEAEEMARREKRMIRIGGTLALLGVLAAVAVLLVRRSA